MAQPAARETDLYAPIKMHLERQGYVVKGEVGAADIVALRDDEDPVIVELKSGFSLALFHQGIVRQAISDAVYVAVPRGTGRPFAKSLKNNIGLCRRLGLGLITVRLRDGFVEVHLDPAPYRPRQSVKRKTALLKEFNRRVGDPNTGGSTRVTLVTAYRQDALRCLAVLLANGPSKAAVVAKQSNVQRAQRMMADNHYGWFDRTQRGVYALSPNGERATRDFAAEIAGIAGADRIS